MKQLNIFELQSSIDKKKTHRTTVFDQVLERCHRKIVIAAQKEFYECIYDVPHYVAGLPLFNVNNCINHIVDQLKLNGFEVTYYFPKTLLISWRPKNVPAIEHNGSCNRPNRSVSKAPSIASSMTLDTLPTMNIASPHINSTMMNYIPYKNEKGKFVLNVD